MAFIYKILGQESPGDTSSTLLYQVPINASTIISSLAIANISTSDKSFSIYVVASGDSVADSNCLMKDVALSGNASIQISVGITLSDGDAIYVKSNTASSFTFHAFGSEVV